MKQIGYHPQFFDENSPQTAMGGMSFLPFFILIEVGLSYMVTWVSTRAMDAH